MPSAYCKTPTLYYDAKCREGCKKEADEAGESKFCPPEPLKPHDGVFQPRKVARSGLWKAFAGHILIFVHKEKSLDVVARLYPASHYVMVDDKLRILEAIKAAWQDRVTTVFPKRGHCAREHPPFI